MPNITSASVDDELAELVVDDATGITAGSSVHVYGTSAYVGTNKLDGHHVVLVVDGLAVRYPVNNVDDIASTLTPGAVLVDEVTWADVADLEVVLGYELAGDDLAFAELVVGSANHWCWHRREASGYVDSPVAAPEENAKLAVVLMALALFRERGSVDSFQSYEGFPVGPPVGSLGQLLRLLRCNKPRIG